MEMIKNWAFSLCVAAIVGSVMKMLLPDGGLQKTFKTVLCVFFLCVMLVPLSEIKIPDTKAFFKKYEYEISDFENSYGASEEFIEKKLEESAFEVLGYEGILPEDIDAEVNISDEGDIYINKFVLSLNDGSNAEKAAKTLYQKIGIRPETVIYGENENG